MTGKSIPLRYRELARWLRTQTREVNDSPFILSCAHQLRRYNGLTYEQWKVVDEIYDRQVAPPSASASTPHTQYERAPYEWQTLGVTFTLASAYKTEPTVSVIFNDNNVYRIVLKTFDNNSKYLFVSRAEDKTHLMSYDIQRGFIKWSTTNQAVRNMIRESIDRFVSDPVAMMKMYADHYERCGFCGLKLTDPRSIKVGYGPVCANNHGMPWGDKDDGY